MWLPTPMLTDAIDRPAWDLAVPSSMRNRFSAHSFYVVIDGLSIAPVRHAAKIIKACLCAEPGIRVRGPLALPTVRRRHMVMREMASGDSKGLYVKAPKRFRNVLLVINPTASAIASMIGLTIPNSVNVRIEPYQNQFDLKEDR